VFITTKYLQFSLEIWHICRRARRIPPERKAARTLPISVLRVCASSLLTVCAFSPLIHRLSELIQRQQPACAAARLCAVREGGEFEKQADFCAGGPTSTITLQSPEYLTTSGLTYVNEKKTPCTFQKHCHSVSTLG